MSYDVTTSQNMSNVKISRQTVLHSILWYDIMNQHVYWWVLDSLHDKVTP